MSPSELLKVFEQSHAASQAVFGPYSIYPEFVSRHLATLVRSGLIERGPLVGRRREYAVMPLGVELLDSLDDATAYARSRYEHLVRYSRRMQHLDPCLSPLYIDPDSEATRARLLRRSAVLLFGTVLGPKWTFATLTALTWGSVRFTQIIEVVNGAASASPDVVTGRLADSVLTARLGTLRHLGLAAWEPNPPGRRGVYVLTCDGRALMEALEPVAAFGIARDAEMTAAVKAM